MGFVHVVGGENSSRAGEKLDRFGVVFKVYDVDFAFAAQPDGFLGDPHYDGKPLFVTRVAENDVIGVAEPRAFADRAVFVRDVLFKSVSVHSESVLLRVFGVCGVVRGVLSFRQSVAKACEHILVKGRAKLGEGVKHAAFLRVEVAAGKVAERGGGSGFLLAFLRVLLVTSLDGFRKGLCFFGESADSDEGNNIVGEESRGGYRENNMLCDGRDKRGNVRDGGVEEFKQKHRKHAENHHSEQTNSAVDVEFAVGVIPPARVEEFFHNVRGRVFENARKQNAEYKDQPPLLNTAENRHVEARTPAVNRAVRTVQKSAVYEFLLRDRADNHFPHPPDDRVEQEPQKPVFNQVHLFRPPRGFSFLTERKRLLRSSRFCRRYR